MKRLGIAVLMVAWVVLVLPRAGLAQDAPPVTYERYDVAIDVKPDGSFAVQEIQQIRFDGEFTQAFAEIPLAYTTRIDDVSIYEGEAAYTSEGQGPGTFTTNYDGDNLAVDWTFERTRPGDVRTFVLAYTVAGGLWSYPDGDLLEWRAVPADRSGVPVQASRVTVTLPVDSASGLPVPVQDLRATAFGAPANAESSDSQVIFEANAAIPDGTALQVQVGFPHGLVAAEPQPWQVAEDTAALAYRYKALDNDFTINADGTVDVEERHRLVVEAGALRQGVHNIKHSGMDDVVDVAVWEDEQPYAYDETLCESCYWVTQTPRAAGWVTVDSRFDTLTTDDSRTGRTEIFWTTPALVKGEETTFRLGYTLVGALQIADDAQTFNWTIIFDEQDVPVESASVRIDLPPGVEPADALVTGGLAEEQPDGSLLLKKEGPIASTIPWMFSVTLPAGATGATKPQWQQDVEAATLKATAAEARQARMRLLMGGLGVVILLLGLLSLLLVWYRWGRDEPVPLPAEYIPDPPSDLPPGIVAYLLDERPSTKGALASLFHLATLGLLRIRLTPEINVRRNWAQKLTPGQTVVTFDGRSLPIPGHLVTLFNDLSPAIPTDSGKELDEIAKPFQAALPTVYEQMAKEVGPLFDTSPVNAINRWRGIGAAMILFSLLGLFFGCFLDFSVGKVALIPGLSLFAVGVAWVLASRWMPQRNSAGAAEAAKWRAFRRYLLNLKEYGNQAEAQEILDRHFAYAVALDVDEVVLRDAEGLGAQLPVWTRPIDIALQDVDIDSSSSSGGSHPEQSLSWRPPSTHSGQPAHVESRHLSLSGLSQQIGVNLSKATLNLSRTLGTAAGDGDSTTGTLNKTLRSSSGSSASRYSGSSSSSSFSSSRSSSFSSSNSSSRSSSSRSSGGGGSRGFR